MRDIVAGIIITGGSGGSGVELLRGGGTTCTLPSLPEARTYHTQAGLVACGGSASPGIHTSCVTLQPRTLLGVMNAADYYGLEELKHACSGFIQVSGACKDFSIADIP